VGTTVRVQEFLSKLPVRKQTVAKTSTKVLTNIRKLLRAYAFARPETRFAFKVLKSKDVNSNWTYAPSPTTATLHEIAAKIVAIDTPTQCSEWAKERVVTESPERSAYSIHALVLDPVKGVF
jgi:DNA mismatch repair ATPase MutL